MKCPHCGKEIDNVQIARYLAAKGGKLSKRTITPEQQAKMQKGRAIRKEIQTLKDGDMRIKL